MSCKIFENTLYILFTIPSTDENGRLVYDRSYLMELRGTEKSQARPVNLPDLEIILDTVSVYLYINLLFYLK